jgi:type I restriction enzyme S subunit
MEVREASVEYSVVADPRVPAGYKQTEVGVIPEDWEIVDAGSIGRFRGGNAFPTLQQGALTGEYPFFKVSDMNNPGNETCMETANNYISEATRKRLGAIVFPPKTIVFAKVGAAVFLERKKLLKKPSCLDNNMAGYVISDARADHRYIHYFLLSFRLGSLVNTTALPSLSGSVLNGIKVPLPPTKAEQEAIAEALSDADALIESLEQLLAKKRHLKQGAMQQLLTGKKRLPGFSGEWEVKRFDGVLSRVNAKAHQIQTSDYQAIGRYPVVDQGKDLIVGFSDLHDKSFQCPEGGVIVFGDHTCIVKFVDFDFLVGADGTQIMVAKNGQCTRFHALQLQLKGISPTGYNRHFKFLKEREFLAPPFAEQTAIATVLSDMDAELAALEEKLAKARAIKQGMMQELLTGRIRLV